MTSTYRVAVAGLPVRTVAVLTLLSAAAGAVVVVVAERQVIIISVSTLNFTACEETKCSYACITIKFQENSGTIPRNACVTCET